MNGTYKAIIQILRDHLHVFCTTVYCVSVLSLHTHEQSTNFMINLHRLELEKSTGYIIGLRCKTLNY